MEVWDQAVKDSTRQFNYEDSTVRLLVDGVKYQVRHEGALYHFDTDDRLTVLRSRFLNGS